MYAITVRPTDQTDAKGRHRPGPENMEWTQVPTPTPASGEVRVAVKAVGMNRADLLQRQGLYPPPPGVSETMGLEVCGTIDALGDDVDGWQMGDEVVALLAGGGYAEQVIVKQQRGGWAAAPGTSNHGWALAVDLGGGINGFGSPEHEWMRANAPTFASSTRLAASSTS